MEKDYEIGYGKPPKKSQFKKGQSGNSKGRPKNSKNTYVLLDEALSKKMTVIENGEQIQISKRQAIILQLVNKGVKGEIKAIGTLLPHMLMSDAKEEDKAKILAALSNDDEKIIENFMKELTNYDGIEKEMEGENNG